MAEQRPMGERQKTARQEEFHGAENESVLRQAGANLGERRAPIPTPGDRLTGSQAEREIGRDSRSSLSQAERAEMEARKADAESEALRQQYAGAAADDTDSKLEAEKIQARVEGLIGNPD